MVGPGIAAGTVSDTAAMHVDVLPTLAAMIGAPHDERWAGSDLRKLVRGRTAFGELIREGGLETRMVSDGKRKLVETVDALGAAPRSELYDLAADPTESRPEPAAATEPLVSELTRMGELARGHALARENVVLDESAEERLRALGYMN
jgi:arylsulfatase A-like enzyme